jgi:hypothetical protein
MGSRLRGNDYRLTIFRMSPRRPARKWRMFSITIGIA